MTTQITTIPANWDVANPDTWTLSTTVDAHMGYHKTGMVMREYREITHRANDLGMADEYTISDDGTAVARDGSPLADHAEWWANVLGHLHAAEIALAEASPEQLASAAATLGVQPDPNTGYDLWSAFTGATDDLETQADAARQIVAALLEQG